MFGDWDIPTLTLFIGTIIQWNKNKIVLQYNTGEILITIINFYNKSIDLKFTFLCWVGCRRRSCPWCKRFWYRFASRNSSCPYCSRGSASICSFCWWYWWCLFRYSCSCTSRTYFLGWRLTSRVLCVFIYATIVVSFWNNNGK